MMQPKSAYKHSNKESDIHVVQIALLMLFPLVIVLVWIALMYDKLLTNPILAILLVLGGLGDIVWRNNTFWTNRNTKSQDDHTRTQTDPNHYVVICVCG